MDNPPIYREIIPRRYPRRDFDPNKVNSANEVLSSRRRTWRMQCPRMKQITRYYMYRRIATQNAWKLSNRNLAVHPTQDDDPAMPTALNVFWPDSWVTLRELQGFKDEALLFFQMKRHSSLQSRQTVFEWTPREGQDQFRIVKILQARFVQVLPGRYLEFYKVRWRPMRIKREHFAHFHECYNRFNGVLNEAMRGYMQVRRRLAPQPQQQQQEVAVDNDNIELDVLGGLVPDVPHGRRMDEVRAERIERVEPFDQEEADENEDEDEEDRFFANLDLDLFE